MATELAPELRCWLRMGKFNLRGDAYLHALLDGKQVIADAVREQRTTPERRTPVTPKRWWFALSAFALLCAMAACSGNKGGGGDTYARGVLVQEECCENLQGPARDSCLKEVVRVDDANAQRTATNQQTYACITEHFVCDPATGHETKASAQAQHDCTDDLQ